MRWQAQVTGLSTAPTSSLRWTIAPISRGHNIWPRQINFFYDLTTLFVRLAVFTFTMLLLGFFNKNLSYQFVPF